MVLPSVYSLLWPFWLLVAPFPWYKWYDPDRDVHLSTRLTSAPLNQMDIEKNGNPLLPPAPIYLSWSDLTFCINEKTILDGVSGELASGQLLAVMGPSGTHIPSRQPFT